MERMQVKTMKETREEEEKEKKDEKIQEMENNELHGGENCVFRCDVQAALWMWSQVVESDALYICENCYSRVRGQSE